MLCSLCAFSGRAAVYKEGKVVKAGKSTTEVGMMRWGNNLLGEDRLVGKVRRFDIPKDLSSSEVRRELEKDIVLTFDAYDNKKNRLDTIDLKFSMVTYGYKRSSRGYYEGQFCVDFKKIGGAYKISLVNIGVGDISVIYKTFNISMDLHKTGFKIPEPKVTPIRH